MIIKDRVKTKIPSISKQLHGHVCIDLHNHNSGFTERIEADNLVTNAIDRAFPIYCGANKANSNSDGFFPIATKVLGGIMLFKNTLTESAMNMKFPDNPIVAFAGQTQVTDDPQMGSLNVLESGEVSGGYKTVWDFSTAQANGTISSLARTSKDIANGPLVNGVADSAHSSMGIPWPLYYDTSDDFIYAHFGTDVYKCNIKYDNLPVGFAFPQPYLAESTGDTLNASNWAPNSDGYAYTYGFTQVDDKFYVDWQRIKCSDGSFTETIGYATHILNDAPADASNENFCLNGAYAFIFKNDYKKIYRLNMQNTSDITEIDISNFLVPSSYWTAYMSMTPSGVLMMKRMDSSKTGLIYISTSPITKIETRTTDSSYYMTNKQHLQSKDGVVYFVNTNNSFSYPGETVLSGFLGTIANISPVTKTASQSMKITYTLTNA